MNKIIFAFLSAVLTTIFLWSFASCDFTKKPQNEIESTSEAPSPQEKDSTVYGVSDEFGQSTFSLITEKGDTLFLLREKANGDLSQIAGDVDFGKRFAITYTSIDGELYLNTAINLEQLENVLQKKHNFQLYNNLLILNKDTVTITELTNTHLTIKTPQGKEQVIEK